MKKLLAAAALFILCSIPQQTNASTCYWSYGDCNGACTSGAAVNMMSIICGDGTRYHQKFDYALTCPSGCN